MTLDKQIILMEELLSDDDHWSSKKAKSEYKQLLKWLKDYKRLLERPQGEWIEKEETPASVSYYCSVCKTEGIPITPFCPWCGARMKGGAE